MQVYVSWVSNKEVRKLSNPKGLYSDYQLNWVLINIWTNENNAIKEFKERQTWM